MKLFFAGAEAFEDILIERQTNMLMSYFHIPSKYHKNPKIKELSGMKSNQLLFIDSGAFSAFTLMEEIKIDDYISFCKKTDADYYASYDAIGDPAKTLENQKYMEEQGVNPVPTFHYGEDWKYLEYYIKNYKFIAIGGMVPIERGKLEMWLDKLFVKFPNHDFHGFGLTTKKLVAKYPWFSVDSSAWLSGGKSKALFDLDLGTVKVNDLHREPKWIKKCEHRGFDIKELQDNKNYKKRLDFNILSYLEMQNKHNPWYPKKITCDLSGWF